MFPASSTRHAPPAPQQRQGIQPVAIGEHTAGKTFFWLANTPEEIDVLQRLAEQVTHNVLPHPNENMAARVNIWQQMVVEQLLKPWDGKSCLLASVPLTPVGRGTDEKTPHLITGLASTVLRFDAKSWGVESAIRALGLTSPPTCPHYGSWLEGVLPSVLHYAENKPPEDIADQIQKTYRKPKLETAGLTLINHPLPSVCLTDLKLHFPKVDEMA